MAALNFFYIVIVFSLAVCTVSKTHHEAANVSILVINVLGSTVVSPYVGMARKQNGGYNASIS